MGKVRWQDLDEYDRAGSQKFKRHKKEHDDELVPELFDHVKPSKKPKRK
jgi:hypothetical protein